MKVRVADLKPNPYRNMRQYPIDDEKVRRLAQSIRDTTFWDNILARPGSNGDYEIAYGHHRLLALRKIGRDEIVDIPVRKLTDEQMLKIMANENGEEWGGQTHADLETIRTVRQYLIDHPEVVDRIDYFKSSPTGLPGAAAIARFLGGIWSEGKVQSVLEIIVPVDKGEIDETIMRQIPTTSEARKFVTAVRGRPVSEQRRVAKQIISGEVERAGIRAAAIAARGKRSAPARDLTLVEILNAVRADVQALNSRLHREVMPHRKLFREYARDAFPSLVDLHTLYRTLDQLFTSTKEGTHGSHGQTHRRALAARS